MPLPQVMLVLHELFTRYDLLADEFDVYKVETIGDGRSVRCHRTVVGLQLIKAGIVGTSGALPTCPVPPTPISNVERRLCLSVSVST